MDMGTPSVLMVRKKPRKLEFQNQKKMQNKFLKGGVKLGVHWKRQELDLKIMKLLYEHGAVQGKTIVDKLSQVNQVKRQKVYDRIKGLQELKIIAGVKYLGITWEEKRKKKKNNPRNLGTMYFLTMYGVQQAKAILYNKEITGNERSFKPEESDIETYWQASQIMSNTDLEFTSARKFKKHHQLQRNFIVDMVYKDWYIVIAKNNREIYKNLLIQQSRQA